ncbi:MAG: MBL fold metallo-hydrolase [Candidatus Aquicultor sp.]
MLSNEKNIGNGGAVKVSWFGHAMFLIESSSGIRIITDPVDAETGYTPPEVAADIITLSHHHHDHNNVAAVGGSPRVIDAIAEFHINDIFIEGISSYHDEVVGEKRGRNTIYKFIIDGLSLAHMGDYGQAMTGEQVKALKGVDVLFIPVGGVYTIDHKQAAAVVKALKPKVAIPMHYKTGACTIKVEGVEPFVREMPAVKHVGSTVSLSASTLPSEPEVWVMEYIR